MKVRVPFSWERAPDQLAGVRARAVPVPLRDEPAIYHGSGGELRSSDRGGIDPRHAMDRMVGQSVSNGAT